MARTRPASLLSDRRGTTAIEYAIILPALLLFLLGILDTGRLLWTYSALYRGAEAAARCAAVNVTDCASTSQIRNQAVAAAWGLTVDASAFTVTNPSCGVQVSASYSFTFTIPGFSAITLNPTACHPI